MNSIHSIALASVIAISSATWAQQPDAGDTALSQPAKQPAPKERVAAIKKAFQESQVKLRTYEWIETTALSLKGEEKSSTQKRCYYGEDSKVVKIALNSAPPAEKPRGLRGRIAEKKKEEIEVYMDQAAALVHHYVPPDQEHIQKSVEAGKASIHILDPGKRARVEFADYYLPGDILAVEIDLANNALLGLHVDTYLNDLKDAITLDVRFDALPNGIVYTARTQLDADAKHVTVVVENSGYRDLKP